MICALTVARDEEYLSLSPMIIKHITIWQNILPRVSRGTSLVKEQCPEIRREWRGWGSLTSAAISFEFVPVFVGVSFESDYRPSERAR